MTTMRVIDLQKGHHTTAFGYVYMRICRPFCKFVKLVERKGFVCDRWNPRTFSVIGVSLLWCHVLMRPV